MQKAVPPGSAVPGQASAVRMRRLIPPAVTLSAVLLAAALAGRADRSDGPPAAGPAPVPDGGVSGPAPEAEIVVLRGGRERLYSSRQLPPDGRLVFRKWAEERARRGGAHPPAAIADWIFRVVPDADEVRITLRNAPGDHARFEYHRGDTSPT